MANNMRQEVLLFVSSENPANERINGIDLANWIEMILFGMRLNFFSQMYTNGSFYQTDAGFV